VSKVVALQRFACGKHVHPEWWLPISMTSYHFFGGTCSTKLGGYQSGVDIIIDVSVGFLLQLGLTGDESPTDVNASAEISRVWQNDSVETDDSALWSLMVIKNPLNIYHWQYWGHLGIYRNFHHRFSPKLQAVHVCEAGSAAKQARGPGEGPGLARFMAMKTWENPWEKPGMRINHG